MAGTVIRKKPFKLLESSMKIKRGIVAATVEEVKAKGRQFNHIPLTQEVSIVLNEDGTEIEDDEYLSSLPDHSILLLLMEGERWASSDGGRKSGARRGRGYVKHRQSLAAPIREVDNVRELSPIDDNDGYKNKLYRLPDPRGVLSLEDIRLILRNFDVRNFPQVDDFELEEHATYICENSLLPGVERPLIPDNVNWIQISVSKIKGEVVKTTFKRRGHSDWRKVVSYLRNDPSFVLCQFIKQGATRSMQMPKCNVDIDSVVKKFAKVETVYVENTINDAEADPMGGDSSSLNDQDPLKQAVTAMAAAAGSAEAETFIIASEQTVSAQIVPGEVAVSGSGEVTVSNAGDVTVPGSGEVTVAGQDGPIDIVYHYGPTDIHSEEIVTVASTGGPSEIIYQYEIPEGGETIDHSYQRADGLVQQFTDQQDIHGAGDVYATEEETVATTVTTGGHLMTTPGGNRARISASIQAPAPSPPRPRLTAKPHIEDVNAVLTHAQYVHIFKARAFDIAKEPVKLIPDLGTMYCFQIGPHFPRNHHRKHDGLTWRVYGKRSRDGIQSDYYFAMAKEGPFKSYRKHVLYHEKKNAQIIHYFGDAAGFEPMDKNARAALKARGLAGSSMVKSSPSVTAEEIQSRLNSNPRKSVGDIKLVNKDPYQNLIHLATELPDFLKHFAVSPSTSVICCNEEAILELDTICRQVNERVILHFDTSLEIANGHMTVLSFSHPFLKKVDFDESVNVPLAFLVHQGRTKDIFEDFLTKIRPCFTGVILAAPKLLVTDRDCINFKFLDNYQLVFCWSYLKREVTDYLKTGKGKKLGLFTIDEYALLERDIDRLLRADSLNDLMLLLDHHYKLDRVPWKMDAFRKYFNTSVRTLIADKSAAFVLRRLKVPNYERGLINKNDILNNVLSDFARKKGARVDYLVVALKFFSDNLMKEVRQGYQQPSAKGAFGWN